MSKVAPVWEADAAERGRQRAHAGIPRIDTDSWQRARALRTTDHVPGPPADKSTARAVVDRQAVSDVVAVFGADARLWTDEILSRLAAVDARYVGVGR